MTLNCRWNVYYKECHSLSWDWDVTTCTFSYVVLHKLLLPVVTILCNCVLYILHSNVITHSHWWLVAVACEQSLFEQVECESLEKLADLPPPSAFDEMISWTKRGILWKFPVDNEQGTTTSKLQSPTSHKGSMLTSNKYLSGRTSSTINVYLKSK